MTNKPSQQVCRPKGIVIFGPTASGKTALAVRLAKTLGGEVVNADSRQLYEGMTILTAAPTAEDMQGIPHHLFEILNPKEKITATAYAEKARACIRDILARGKVPIVCGGTGFYLKVLFEGISSIPTVCDDLQKDLRDTCTAKGGAAMLAELKEVDPVIAEKLFEGDTQRILRALGVYHQTGRPLSYFQSLPPEGGLTLPFLHVSLQPEKAWLDARIEKRFGLMEKAGVEAEMRTLKNAGYALTDHGIQTLGAREFFQYFEDERSYESVAEDILLQTKQYAKRQLTWARTQFKSDIILPNPCDDAESIIAAFQA